MTERLLLSLAVLTGLASNTMAAPGVGSDPFIAVAREKNVAVHVLRSISLRESGRGGQPHPWTLNVHGRGFHYASREDAYRALKAYREAGYTSIDVGYMQVNLRYHGHRFTDLWTALDPLTNIRTGADILRDYYQATGSVERAVARYHSAHPERGAAYLDGVVRQYRQLKARETRVTPEN
jgi:Transglycosylase SLT domain